MNIVLICVVALTASLICVLLRKYNPEYSMVIALAAGVLIFMSVISSISPIIEEVKNLISLSKLPWEYAAVLFKALGICFLTQFAADACQDAGESALSSKIELAGKVMIVLIALPLFEKITQIALFLIG